MSNVLNNTLAGHQSTGGGAPLIPVGSAAK